jgi:DNA-binding transcriptional LysR family regulator
MEFRQLRYFVAVAEELHFGRAARRLHMAQPPLSQQIRALEETLGVPLFLRTSRKVELTEQGRLFLEQALGLLAGAEKARATMRAAHRGEEGRISIGYVTSAAYSLMPAILREFNRTRPNVEIRCFEMNFSDQWAALEDGRIQVGLNRTRSSDPAFISEVLINEHLVLALPSSFPQAKKEKLRLRDVADEGFIMSSRAYSTTYYDAVIAACRKAGFSPRVVQEGNSVQTLLALVGAGLGVTLAPSSLQHLKPPGVVYRELPPSDSQDLELALVWRREEQSPVVKAFNEIARGVAKAARG